MSIELLQIGSVCRPHGLRGELRVRLHDPTSAALDALKELWTGSSLGDGASAISADDARLRQWRVRAARRVDGGFYLLTLDGLGDRNGADGLRGQVLYAKRADLPALAEDEVYLADLVGCRVEDLDGRDLGRAAAVQDIAGQSLLVVERPTRADALVPLVPQILVEVDLARRVVRIDPPEGLLDLDIAPPAKSAQNFERPQRSKTAKNAPVKPVVESAEVASLGGASAEALDGELR